MRVLVVGAGALGGFYGAMLARAGNDVTVLARGAALDAVRASGTDGRIGEVRQLHPAGCGHLRSSGGRRASI